MPSWGLKWTAAELEILQTKWAHLSATQLMYLLPGRSRNSIIGKVCRMGLTAATRKGWTKAPASNGPRNPGKYPRQRRKSGSNVGARDAGIQHRIVMGLPQPAQVAPEDDQLIPVDQRRSLFNLGQGCKWPVGNPRDRDFFFCGAARIDEVRPYCLHHTRKSVASGIARPAAIYIPIN
mgnify:CR=1 FL=1